MGWTTTTAPQFSQVLIGKIFKSLAISGIIVYVIYILLSNHPCCYSSTIFNSYSSTHKTVIGRRHPDNLNRPELKPDNNLNRSELIKPENNLNRSELIKPDNNLNRSELIKPDNNLNRSERTNVSHIVFGITSSVKTWRSKKWYIESWWRPNTTRGHVYLDGHPGHWPPSSPPYKVSEDTSRYRAYDKHPLKHAIRMARVVVEAFREEKEGARWFVMSDDDTVFFVENLVRVLAKYDHEGYFYVGMNSESHLSNWLYSFGMAFGGGGFALSYPLAEAVVKNMDVCLERYPTLYGSDHIMQSCVADLGVSLTQEKGFHQIDLHNDISGYLSAHPQSPLISLHHLDFVDPIFPTMTRTDGLTHLMSASKVAGQSRLLQQTVCHFPPKNWTFSVSWGYSVQVYESIVPPSVLRRPLQTFTPWSKSARPFFVFDTRVPNNNNPCEAPHVFFFDSVVKREDDGYGFLSRYSVKKKRGLPACFDTGNHSAAGIPEIRVLSPLWELDLVGSRRECCEVTYADERNATEIRISECIKDGIIL